MAGKAVAVIQLGVAASRMEAVMTSLNRWLVSGCALIAMAGSACVDDPASQSVPQATPELGAAATPLAAFSGYVMAYFTESPSGTGSNYGLHLAVSPDSLNWTPLNQNNPVVTPTLGTLGLRDPFILRKQDGTFEVIATDLKGTDFSLQNQFIHVWDSTDLRTFTGYRRVKLHSMPTHSWAPEAFWDASRNQYAIIYSANNGTRDVIMVNYTTDFLNVGTAQVYFDPGFNVIDADVLVGGGTGGATNYLYYKVANGGSLRGARSSSLSPGSFNAGTYTTTISHGGTEAPILVRSLTANTWYLWGDTYTPNGVFYAWQSSSIDSDAWTPVDQKLYTQPVNSKHATIQPITATEMANLIAKWGAPSWNRLKSYNFPDRYVRHQNNVGRIDTYPFDPYQDEQWRMVPGLADAAGVSFQSVNFPTMYLRQSNLALVLSTNDNSAAFRGDATFYRVAGFADATWSSFRSFSVPGSFIRHFNFVLRLDPVTTSSTTVTKQDATFRVGF
jgi:hypothetical protein